MSRASASRRSLPIHAYVGPNGGGKSLAMVNDTLASLENGRPVLSTVRLIDWRAPCASCDARPCECGVNAYPAHPLYVPFTDYRQLLTWAAGDVLMDEVTGVASSRESQSMPAQVANYIVQLRRRDVLLRWTSPNWARADKIMREVTLGVTYCVGMLPQARQRADGRLWRDRRLFYWRTFDATVFDEFTAHKREKVRPHTRQWFWRPGSPAMHAYDTLDAIESLGASSDGGAGLCITCGGRRSPTPCSCADQVEMRAARRRRPQTAPAGEDRDAGRPALHLHDHDTPPAAPASHDEHTGHGLQL